MLDFISRGVLTHHLISKRKEHAPRIAKELGAGWWAEPIVTLNWLEDDVYACATWWGFRIVYNIRHMEDTDPEFRDYVTMRHELTHCLFMQNGLGVNYHEPYHMRFHENAAFYMGGSTKFPSVFRELDEEKGEGEGLKILIWALYYKREGYPTARAKDEACKRVTGWDWESTRQIYVEKAYKETPRYTLTRMEDYKRWKEAKEKEKEEKTPPEEKPGKKPETEEEESEKRS